MRVYQSDKNLKIRTDRTKKLQLIFILILVEFKLNFNKNLYLFLFSIFYCESQGCALCMPGQSGWRMIFEEFKKIELAFTQSDKHSEHFLHSDKKYYISNFVIGYTALRFKQRCASTWLFFSVFWLWISIFGRILSFYVIVNWRWCQLIMKIINWEDSVAAAKLCEVAKKNSKNIIF